MNYNKEQLIRRIRSTAIELYNYAEEIADENPQTGLTVLITFGVSSGDKVYDSIEWTTEVINKLTYQNLIEERKN